MKNIAIIGAGPLGRWLALAASRAGFRVLLEDVLPGNLHHAREYLRQHHAWDQQEPNAGDGASATPSVEYVGTVEDAVREADMAIDCVPDELESKLEILWLIDRMAPPRTIIATPTVRLDIDDLARCTYRADRCVALVLDPRDFTDGIDGLTIRAASDSSNESLQSVRAFWEKLGVTVSVFSKDRAVPLEH